MELNFYCKLFEIDFLFVSSIIIRRLSLQVKKIKGMSKAKTRMKRALNKTDCHILPSSAILSNMLLFRDEPKKKRPSNPILI